MATLTSRLAKRMAAVKQAQTEVLRDIKTASSIATKRHNQMAEYVAGTADQLDKDPYNAELIRQDGEARSALAGLYSAVEYGHTLHESVTGKPRPERHEIKDAGNRFAKKGSLGHRLRELLQG